MLPEIPLLEGLVKSGIEELKDDSIRTILEDLLEFARNNRDAST